jgi:hypothetical protein
VHAVHYFAQAAVAGEPMPRVASLTNAAVFVYAGDHAPPHFYVLGPNTNAVIDIQTLRVTRGSYTRRDLAAAIAWAAKNQGLLQAKWREINERG